MIDLLIYYPGPRLMDCERQLNSTKLLDATYSHAPLVAKASPGLVCQGWISHVSEKARNDLDI